MSQRDAIWIALAAALVALLAVAAAIDPRIAVGVLLAVTGLAAALLAPARLVPHTSALGAILAVSLLPSSAFAGLPLGSAYPIIAATVFVVWGVARSPRTERPAKHIGWISAYYAVLLVASLASGNSDLFYLAILPVAIGVLYITSKSTPEQKNRIELGMILLGIGQGALSLIEITVLRSPIIGTQQFTQPDNPFLAGYFRAQGTLGHPLVLSFMLLVALALCLHRAEQDRRWFLPVPVFLLGIVASGSTSALIVALALVALAVFRSAGLLGKTLAILASIGAALIVASSGVLAAYGSELSEQNLAHRLNSLRAVPTLIAERAIPSSVFGSGVTSNEQLFAEGYFYNDGFYAIDNQFVTVLAHAGLLGLVLFLVFLARTWVAADPTYRVALIGLVAMCASFDFLSWYAPAAAFLAVVALSDRATAGPGPSTARSLPRAERSELPAR